MDYLQVVQDFGRTLHQRDDNISYKREVAEVHFLFALFGELKHSYIFYGEKNSLIALIL